MSNLIGQSLGPYRIIEQIGAGGMATVYKAYQPSMDRYVAIKVLPPYLSQDEQFAKRFQREAKAVARLEHAHILPVHDYGEAEGITYLVMRFVEGGTLKQRIAQARLPLSEIDRIVGQIGSALDYAHRLGVIHRDVKPGNVLIDGQGDTYLTDFGLARMMEASDQLTASGVGVGTPAYMSPEQGQGVKVDHRSDIYSLGVILYEMVTGHVPYEAETPMAVMLKHITEPLPLPRIINPNVPEPVELVILKALAKDPAHRYQTAGEMVEALTMAVRKAAEEGAQVAGRQVAGRQVAGRLGSGRDDASIVTRMQRVWARPRGKVVLVGGAVMVLAALGLLLSRLPGQVQIVGPGAATPTSVIAQATATTGKVAQAATPTIARPTVTVLPATPVAPTASAPIAPCRIAQSEKTGTNVNDIFVTDCDGSNTRWVTEGRKSFGHEPAWSPDGQRLVFTDDERGLIIVNADGSDPTPIVSPKGRLEGNFPVWSPDGTRIAWKYGCEIMTIRLDGSDLATVLDHRELSGAGDPEMCANRPRWSPDSQRLAFTTFPLAAHHDPTIPGPHEYRFYVVNADGTGLTKLASFQLPYPRLAGVADVDVSWFPNGRQVALEVSEGAWTQRYQMNADGSGERLEIDSIPESWRPWYWPQWGVKKAQGVPTPTPVAECHIASMKADGNVYVSNCDGSDEHRITNLKSVLPPGVGDRMLSWSPNGEYIVFQSIHEREPGNVDPLLYRVRADGSDLTRLTSGERHDRFPVWSPDGKRIAFHSNCTLRTIAPDGSSEETIVVAGTAEGTGICPNTVAWSPDSKQLAFVSWHDPFPESKRYILYVVNRDGTNLRKLWKFEGGATPTWSPDGKQIGVENGGAYLFNADGNGEPVKVSSIAASWHAWHWPQWGGEAQTKAPTLSPQAEQARAFAEPILQAIADRQPDFEDDFSTDDKGWGIREDSKEGSAIVDGVARLWVNDGSASFGNAGENREDFVMRVDVRIDGDKATQARVKIHSLPGSYWFMLEIDSANNTWLIDNSETGGITKGSGNVSPFGKATQIMIVARGPRVAIHLSGAPVAYLENADLDRPGAVAGGLFCQSSGQGVCEYDNYKIWDLANIPGLPAVATLSPQAAQARAFAEPILQAIADRKPDIADDFSAVDKNWICDSDPLQTAGKCKVADGVVRITPVRGGLSDLNHPWMVAGSFVLMIDARQVSGSCASYFQFFAMGPDRWNNLHLNPCMNEASMHVGFGGQIHPELEGSGGSVRPIGETNHILVIARGSRFAFYLNDVLVTYFEESHLDAVHQIGFRCNALPEMVCEFDNVKFWNLDNVPGLP